MFVTADQERSSEKSPRFIGTPAWERRHAVLMAVLVAQALALLVWAAARDESARPIAGVFVPIALSAVLAAWERVPRCGRSAAMAVGLMAESMLVVNLADGGALAHYHFIVMLIAVAVYEDPRPLLVGAALAVGLHATGVLVPIGGDADGVSRLGFAAVHIASVMVITAALMATWRTNMRIRSGEREQRRRAEQYLDIAESLVIAADRDGIVLVANRAACLLLGRREDEIVGRSWVEIVGRRSERAETVASLQDALAQDGETLSHESEIVRPDGERRIVSWRASLLRDADGEYAGLIASGLDVTEQHLSAQIVERERRDLLVLRRLAHAVASKDDARQDVVDGVVALTDASFGALLEADGAGERLQVTATTVESLAGEQVLVGREVSGAATALLSGAPLFVADAPVSPIVSRRLQESTASVSVLYQPVFANSRPVAVLVVGWPTRLEELGSRETELVALAADEASAALQRVGQLQELRRAALVDPLTGIPNRRAFEAEFGDALDHARATGQQLSLLLLDLNSFKQLNDTLGHEAGDRLLKAATAAWSAELRPGDLLARLGGDEFVVLLPNCGGEDAEVVAERVRLATPHEPGCALGLVTTAGDEDPGAVLRSADAALYADKASGGRARLADEDRLAALDATGLLDAPASPRFDRLTSFAAWALDVPVALLTLVTDERQFFLSNCGLDGYSETPLTHSFCQHPVASGRPLIVEDARQHPMLAGNLAVRDLNVIAYAGIPLTGEGGQVLGVLCAIDTKPRAWTPDDIACLRRIAQRSIEELARPALDEAATA